MKLRQHRRAVQRRMAAAPTAGELTRIFALGARWTRADLRALKKRPAVPLVVFSDRMSPTSWSTSWPASIDTPEVADAKNRAASRMLEAIDGEICSMLRTIHHRQASGDGL